MRVSYSVLRAWEMQDFERAVAMWQGLQTMDSVAMAEGRRFHDEWEKETLETGCLPKIFGGKKLTNPEPEVKIVKKLTDWLTLSGVIDNRDVPEGYEYKTGKSPASFYARGKQHNVYQILDPRLDRFTYFAYNQHRKQVTSEVLHLNKSTLEIGMNWVITLASEMKHTLDSLGYDTSSHEKPSVGS